MFAMSMSDIAELEQEQWDVSPSVEEAALSSLTWRKERCEHIQFRFLCSLNFPRWNEKSRGMDQDWQMRGLEYDKLLSPFNLLKKSHYRQ